MEAVPVTVPFRVPEQQQKIILRNSSGYSKIIQGQKVIVHWQ